MKGPAVTLPADTPQPPYYSVIFASQRSDSDDQTYSELAERMADLATRQPGYLGIDSSRDENGFGITVSYWRSLQDIAAWKANGEHLEAQVQGRRAFYKAFRVHVARVEKTYDGP